ncbi:MAG: hypothetical protein JWL90_1702 [Chthoniobacteraceae bacterium]|nr:hypothetical protein [Chthoniobacteraceae bacterium]
MRHFLSDLSVDYQVDGEFHYLKSPLNPRQNSAPPPSDYSSALNMEGGSFPGGCHMTGIFYQAPLPQHHSVRVASCEIISSSVSSNHEAAG